MAMMYPETWIERVRQAKKLVPVPEQDVYRSPDGRLQVETRVVKQRLEEYLRSEAARRRRRKLTREEEQLCGEYVLLVDNWRTGAWDLPQPPPVWAHRPKAAARRAQAKSA